MIKSKHIVKWGGLAVIVLVVVLTGFLLIPRLILDPDAAYPENQIVSLDGDTLYYLNLTTDYHFGALLGLDPASLESDSVSVSELDPVSVSLNISAEAFACACISILNPPNRSLFGRNFDWYDGKKLIMETHPPNAYSSISMVDVDTLNLSFPTDFLATSADLYPSLAFSPFDGMNEHGVSVGCLVSPGMAPGFNTSLQTLNSLEIMRLALDYTATVDEVVELWGQYNLDYTGGPDLHYMVGDALGNSVIIEWIDGDMMILENHVAWQVVTNFRIYEASAADLAGCWRYSEATGTLSAGGIVWNPETLRNLLANISVTGTQWSSVYDMANTHAYITVERQYEAVAWEFWL